MNSERWKRSLKTRQAALRGFRRVNKDALDEVEAAEAVIAKHAELIRERDRLEAEAKASVPEGHVRCQAVHYGLLICDQIAERGALPKGWVVSLVGDICYCPEHVDHADVVNAPTLEAPLKHLPETVNGAEKRR